MSAQTGTASFVPSPPSSRAIDLARTKLRKAQNEPNPIWIRELKQAARLQRTPIILMTVTALVALLMCSIGGLMSISASPASIGVSLFHTFFSTAFFVVMLAGPAIAANSVASEREGRTWEAVLLTGLPPKTIARGKFLSAFTTICLYIVGMAPVGALPFLFGGITATEVVVAFAFLFLFATLSVAFGLAISSMMGSSRGAIVLTLLLAIFLSIAIFFGLGVGLSVTAHAVWPAVLSGPPVWLPTAYERAPFGIEYLTFLVIIPIASVALPAWFLYEVTVANLMSITEDRSTGVKRWFAIMTPTLVAAAAIPAATTPASHASIGFDIGLSCLFVFLVFCVFVFQADPIGPSRRVLVHWDRIKAGWMPRFFGPGLMKTSTLLVVMGLSALTTLSLIGVGLVMVTPHILPADRTLEVERILFYFIYTATYFLFLSGFAAWIRARSSSSGISRLMLVVAIFFTAIVPWIIAAIAGILADHRSSEAIIVAAPSPFYVFVLLDALTGPTRQSAAAAGIVSSAAWAFIGMGLLAAASARCKRIVDKHNSLLAEADAMLSREDQAVLEAEKQALETAQAPE